MRSFFFLEAGHYGNVMQIGFGSRLHGGIVQPELNFIPDGREHIFIVTTGNRPFRIRRQLQPDCRFEFRSIQFERQIPGPAGNQPDLVVFPREQISDFLRNRGCFVRTVQRYHVGWILLLVETSQKPTSIG